MTEDFDLVTLKAELMEAFGGMHERVPLSALVVQHARPKFGQSAKRHRLIVSEALKELESEGLVIAELTRCGKTIYGAANRPLSARIGGYQPPRPGTWKQGRKEKKAVKEALTQGEAPFPLLSIKAIAERVSLPPAAVRRVLRELETEPQTGLVEFDGLWSWVD